MSNEFYPLGLYYSNALTSERDKDGFNGPGRGYGCQVIGGMYRKDEDTIMEVALQYNPFPSFCGGAYAHSPQVRFWRGSGWRGTYQIDSSFLNIENSEDIPDWLIQLEEPADWDWEAYGYRILANLMFSVMVHQGKRGVVLSGPIHHEVAKFVEQCGNMKHFRKSLAVGSTLRWDEKGGFGTSEGCVVWEGEINVEVQETQEWVH